jgi:hypothetical protein
MNLTRFRYNPIQKYAPQDCVASINGIIDKMDHLVSTNNTHAIQQLKSIFGLGDLKDIRDFAMTIAFPSMFLSFSYQR